MQPEETQPSPVEVREEAVPLLPEREPFWGYTDLGLMMGLLFACFVIIGVVIYAAVHLHPSLSDDPTPMAVPIQFVLYGMIYLCFQLVLGLRYHRPVLASLGWRRSTFNLLAAGLGGAALALGISGLASLLHTPKVPSPVDKLVDTPLSFAMVALLAVVAAPFFEELFFRGFLQPLFSRTLGVVAGILVTAVLFGSLHAPEYSWAWQYVLAISLAGVVFGWVRARANSIIPSTVMHGCFNAMSVIALAVTKYSNYKLDI